MSLRCIMNEEEHHHQDTHTQAHLAEETVQRK